MKRTFAKIGIYCTIFLLLAGAAKAQNADTTAEFKPHGVLWGYAFGDFAWKGATDDALRGGSNQYTKIPVNTNMFQFRRVYLGYNYDISKRFSAEFLLAAEDNFTSGVLGQGNGDILVDNKFAPYLKLMDLRWKNIWHGTDLIVGQCPTPTFAKNGSGMASEEVWGYRSIERTITDIRRTGSFDMGASLQGHFDEKANFGYAVMVGNGTGAKSESDNFKWFYGDIWAKFFDKRLIVDVYGDYQKINWNPMVAGQAEVATTTTTYSTTLPVTPTTTTTYSMPSASGLHHDRNMAKIFVAWNAKKWTVGVEYFMNTLMGDLQYEVGTQHKVYYATTQAMGASIFARGRIYRDKLGFFARYDMYDPSANLKKTVDNPLVTKYAALTSQYEPTTKEQFITAGIDFTPMKNVHIMPNIWLNAYESALSVTGTNGTTAYSKMNSNVTGMKGSDAVYRVTLYYVFGK